MDVTIDNVLFIVCGFLLGMMFWDTIQERLHCFNANNIRKMNKRIYESKKLIRKINRKIKRYVKSDSCSTQYYCIDCTAIPTAYVDKFQSYYMDKGFKVWIDNMNGIDAIYISWEEDDVSGSDNNE